MTKKPIPYGRQSINQDDIEAVIAVLKSDYLTTGPAVEDFEKRFAALLGSTHAVAVANGTAALHLCTLALGVNASSKVITTPISFVATANCVRYCGGQVEFCDVDPLTLNLDPNRVEDVLKTAKPGTYQGLIPVSFAGYPVDMQAFQELAKKYKLWLIEDSCHALGAAFQDSYGQWQMSGNGQYGDLAVFSFHPVKHITTGEGGMIASNNEQLIQKLKRMRAHGISRDGQQFTKSSDGPWYYEMQDLGYNYRITELQCALGSSQLQRLESFLKARQKIAAIYKNELQDLEIILPSDSPTIKHAYHLFTIQVPKRKKLFDYLLTHSIHPQVHYIPIYKQPYYKGHGKIHACHNAENFYEHCLSLPIYPDLSEAELAFVIDTIRKFYKK